MMPSVSVIIPFLDSSPLLSDAIRAYRHLDYSQSSMELILVQNGGGVSFALPEIEKNDKVRLIRVSSQNAYIARNAGAAIASGEILLFTDVDCIVEKDWVGSLVGALKNNNVAAVVGCVRAYQPRAALELFGEQSIFKRELREFDYIAGGNCGIFKAIFNEIGGFDEQFISGGDIDLSMRLKKRGYEIKYVPEAVVYHRHRTTLNSLFGQYRKYGMGWRVLRKKWGYSLCMYPMSKRIIVALIFFLIGLFHMLVYVFKRKSPEAQAYYFRFFYLAIINIALVVGFMTISHRRK